MTAADTWAWPASTVRRVVDGDTFVATVTRDLGFHGRATFDVHLRLNRINASPLHTPAGKAAAAALEALIVGAPVDITTVGAYKYGDEWMAEVVLSDGSNVSDALVAAGHAKPWTGEGPRPGG